ncbi:type IV protein arginine methyltransferase [Malassezia nana]|uniref:Arginine N-methyltransferase 2 n=1 Tax=Malassezia nana TaxID=180528 RepID=A0AAF0EK12_9BASI|nr:type IV protein arginine methyltransferase [Malassezia nana]
MSDSPAPWLEQRIERNLALLKASYEGDLEECKKLLAPTISEGDWDGSADAWYADEDMLRWDALHYAADGGHTEVVRLLLQSGAPWNAVDALGYTAADVAWSRNHTACYGLLFEEGVRQSFLVQKLAQHADIDAENEKPTEKNSGEEADAAQDHALRSDTDDAAHLTLVSGSQNEVTYSNTDFLHSRLTFTQDARGQWRCLDKDNNMVMAEWENEIMLASAKALCEGQKEGFSVLNVGFGLGIVDEAVQMYRPGRHVIIEPHPDVLTFMRQRGWDQRPGVEIFEGTWEQFLMPENDEDGENAMKLGDFDAIYFDTYSQDYADLRAFFECLPNVLSGPDARFSFFHGLAATHQFYYQVYTRLAELDLRDIGLTTTWTALLMHVDDITWDGVKRKYWSLDEYYLPVARMQLV